MGRNRPENGTKSTPNHSGVNIASCPHWRVLAPKCLRVSALQPLGEEAGVGAPPPEIPYKDPRASCPHWRVSGPNALGPRLCSRSGERQVDALSPRRSRTGTPGTVWQWSAAELGRHRKWAEI